MTKLRTGRALCTDDPVIDGGGRRWHGADPVIVASHSFITPVLQQRKIETCLIYGQSFERPGLSGLKNIVSRAGEGGRGLRPLCLVAE